jgi:ATP-dependent DNA helicase PIF1
MYRFPTRMEVDNANSSKMRNLVGEQMLFEAIDSGVPDLRQREALLKNFMAQEKLYLKKGAQVMLIKNIDAQLVNGSLGKVVAFMDEGTFTFYKDEEEDFMRVHQKDETEEDAKLNGEARRKFQEAKMKGEQDGKKSRLFPMVRFTLADNTVRTLLMQPEEWKTEAPGGEIVAKRVQVPLILAWALSIHKAQGQTLERVKVDLGKVFEKGQAYVALSRATNQSGLWVQRFDPKKVMVHPKVTTFYEALVSIEKIRENERETGLKRSASVVEVDEADHDEELEYMYG